MKKWICLLMLGCTAVQADMLDALKAYEQKNYAAAQQQFAELLPLGNQMAAYNLAVMTLKGEGTTADSVVAGALFAYAATLGHPTAENLATSLHQQMSIEQQNNKNQLLNKLLEDQLIPAERNDTDLRSLKPPVIRKALTRKEPVYPVQAARAGIEGYVMLRALVDAQGNVQVAESIFSYPDNVFERSAIAAMKAWKYEASGEVTEVRVQLDFTLEKGAGQSQLDKMIRKFDIWRNAVIGAPVYQEAVAKILHAVNARANVIIKTDNTLPLAVEEPDFKYLNRNIRLSFEFEGFDGSAEVRVDEQGAIVAVTEATYLRYPAAEHLIGKKISNVDTAGAYFIASYLSRQNKNEAYVKPLLFLPANYSSYFWWQEAARGGYLPSQKLLAAMNRHWEKYLLSKADPETMAWAGTRLMLEGQREQGMELLEQAIAKNYAPAKEMKQQFM